MPLYTAAIFNNQAQVDGFNMSLNLGLKIVPFDHEGQLAYLRVSLNAILATSHGLSQAQVDELNALPDTQVLLPDTEEEVETLKSVVQELYVLDSMPFRFSGPVSVGQESDFTQEVPAISPALVGCIGITFSNGVDFSTQDIEFYVDDVLVYTWSVNLARYGHITAPTMSPLFILNEGSRLYAKMGFVGATPGQDVVLRCYFGLASPASIGETFYTTH